METGNVWVSGEIQVKKRIWNGAEEGLLFKLIMQIRWLMSFQLVLRNVFPVMKKAQEPNENKLKPFNKKFDNSTNHWLWVGVSISFNVINDKFSTLKFFLAFSEKHLIFQKTSHYYYTCINQCSLSKLKRNHNYYFIVKNKKILKIQRQKICYMYFPVSFFWPNKPMFWSLFFICIQNMCS